MKDQYIKPGTFVSLIKENEDNKKITEYGIVVNCWNDEMLGHDCYIAFYGEEIPINKEIKPYILRYSASVLNVLDIN